MYFSVARPTGLWSFFLWFGTQKETKMGRPSAFFCMISLNKFWFANLEENVDEAYHG
jgi:hypothetical protein